MFKKWIFLAFAVSSMMLAGCSSSDDGGGASQASLAITTINSKLSAVSDLVGGVSSSSIASTQIPFSNDVQARATGINAVWTNATGVGSLYDGNSYSLKQWMIDEFDENFVNSNGAKVTFAGRIANGLSVFCYLAYTGLAVDAKNLPVAGTYNFSISQFMATACGDGGDVVGMPVTLTVTDTTDDTTYDRLLSFTFPGAESCPFKFYARINTEVISLAQSEDQNCDGRDHASLTVFTHDRATLVSRFYYISKAFSGYPSGYEVYRGYLNETTDEAYVIGFYGGDNDGDTTFENGISFTTVGKPSAGGTVALSVMSINNTIADNVYQGCINSGLSVATDNSLNCTMTGLDATNTHPNVVQDLYDDYANIASIYNMSETISVGFTDNTDMDD